MFRPAGSRVVQRLAASAVDIHAWARSCNAPQLQRLLVVVADCTGPASASQRWQPHGSLVRGFAASAADGEPETREVGNEQVRRLAEEIMQLSLLEVSDLTDILMKRLNIQMPAMGAMGGAPAAAAAPAATSPAAEAAAEAPPKTEFDIKLTGFDAAAKVKVIKEVRTMTSLGLKEAKELVEKAPTVIKSGVKKEEAEELKAKLEAVGGKISLE